VAEVSNELLYEILRAMQARLAQVDGKADENKIDMMALRTQMNAINHNLLAIHQELGGVHTTLIRHEQRLDRIEHRLELHDAPALP
jgi:predicted  nucleic acid-binding Zn-ribbon protein